MHDIYHNVVDWFDGVHWDWSWAADPYVWIFAGWCLVIFLLALTGALAVMTVFEVLKLVKKIKGAKQKWHLLTSKNNK